MAEASAALKPLARLPHRDEPWHLRPASTSLSLGWFVLAGPCVWCSSSSSTAPSQASRQFSAVLDRHPMRVRDDQAGVRQSAAWNCCQATCTASRSGTCSASSTLTYCRKRKILSSLRRFSVSSYTQPPTKSCSSWNWNSFSAHRGPAEGVLHRRQLSKVRHCRPPSPRQRAPPTRRRPGHLTPQGLS